MGTRKSLDELFSKKEVIKTGKFLLGFAVSFFLLSWLFSLVPLEWTELFFAQITLFLLGLFGFSGTIFFGEPALIRLDALALPIAISYLCTGLLEAAIIVAAVASSFGIEAKKRVFGALAAIFTVIVFNVFRIVASILIIIYFGLDAGAFSHDMLFRVFLFATVAGFYFLWFRWAIKKQ